MFEVGLRNQARNAINGAHLKVLTRMQALNTFFLARQYLSWCGDD
jgi:hypothetical protein